MFPDFSKPIVANPVRHEEGIAAPIAGVGNPVVLLSKPRDYFLGIAPFKGQRNTEEHRQDLLRWPYYDRQHSGIGHEFVVFQYTDNYGKVTEEVLLDGNTTCLMHRRGDITLPPDCSGKAYQGRGTRREQDGQALRLYESYNNSGNIKQPGDVLYSAQKLAGFEAKSSFFSAGRGSSALDFAEGTRQGYDGKAKTLNKTGLVSYWQTEIKVVDAELAVEYAKPGKAKMRTNAGLLAAFLVYLAADSVRAKFFMRMYYRSRGVGDTEQPWIALWHKVATETKDTGGSRAVTQSVLEWALYAISRVSEPDIQRGADAENFTSTLGERWSRINMASFWSKYVGRVGERRVA